ncbi:Integration host factor subunit beta [subsurface metagenome]
MNKAELVEEITNKTGLTKKDTGNVVNAIVQTITNTLKKGEKVTLIGFGTFQVIERKARTGMNPQTGETIQILAKKVPKFRAGKELREKETRETGTFEEMGIRLDELGQKMKVITQKGAGKTSKQAKNWGKKLGEMGGKLKKVTQDRVEKLTTQTKTIAQVSKLRSQIRDIKRKREDKISRLGKITYESHLYKKLDNKDLKEIGEEIAKLEKEIRIKEEEIENLKK